MQGDVVGHGRERTGNNRRVLSEGEIARNVDDDGASGDGTDEGNAGEDVDAASPFHVDITVEIQAGVETAGVVEGAGSVQILAGEGRRVGRGRRRRRRRGR